jgi:hypothetical protein
MQITEDYEDYIPPGNIQKDIEALLKPIESQFTKSICRITLRKSSELQIKKVGHETIEGKLYKTTSYILGNYNTSRNEITLYINNIFSIFNKTELKIAPIRRYILSRTLYHEFAHHLHFCYFYRGPEDDAEKVAEDWAADASNFFMEKNYKYLLPIFNLYKRRLDKRLGRDYWK